MVIGIDASRANQRERTGTEWYSWHLIRELIPRLAPHRVRLYVREPLLEDWGELGSRVDVRVLGWKPGLLWSHLRLGWELLWHPPQLLWVPADTIPLIRRCRTLTTIHDIAFEAHPELYSRRSIQRRLMWLKPLVSLVVRIVTFGRFGASEVDYHRWSIRHALRVSYRILTVSEFTKQDLIRLLGADPQRIFVTYQGVLQPDFFSNISESQRTQAVSELQIQARFFLYVGRLERKKNIAAILQAYQAYRQAGGTAELVLVGSPGYGWEQDRSIIHQSAISHHVHQLGWLPQEQLAQLRASAIAFIFLSAYEGFGVPPLESFSAGVPVIASRAGSIPEILGAAAIYVNPADPNQVATAMQRLETDKSLSQSLVHQGQSRVRKFTWANTAERTKQILIDSLPK